MIHIYYGDGKGKTTAAAGLALRAAGWGEKVVFAQFLKLGTSGELASLEKLENVIVLKAKPVCGFLFNMDEGERAKIRPECMRMLEEAFSIAKENGAGVLVLDEAVDAYAGGVLEHGALEELLREKPDGCEVVLTGHSLPAELEKAADYVTEMRKVKHPYDSGASARKGVEF